MNNNDLSFGSILREPQNFYDVLAGIIHEMDAYKPSDLKEIDSVRIAKLKDVQVKRVPDVIKRLDNGTEIAIIAIENQETIDHSMPLRIRITETAELLDQLRKITKENKKLKKGSSAGEYMYHFTKDDKLTPAITILLYYGKEPYNGPRKLGDIYPKDNPLSKYADQGYEFFVIDVQHLEDEELDNYHNFIKALFGFIRYQHDKDKLESFCNANTDLFEQMDAINCANILEITNSEEILGMTKEKLEQLENEGGSINMCKALQDMRDEAILKTLYGLTNKGLLSLGDAANEANMSEAEFKEKMTAYFKSQPKS